MSLVPPSGPCPADIMIVGDHPGTTEMRELRPFCGEAGVLLTQMLHEAGLLRSECFLTNVARVQPYKNNVDFFFGTKKEGLAELDGRYPKTEILQGLELLGEEITACRPRLILALGATALWALTGKEGIAAWRGSILQHASGAWIIPIYHPAGIQRNWDWRFITVNDLRRAKRLLDGQLSAPLYQFTLEPTFPQALDWINKTTARAEHTQINIAFDIETWRQQIACIGYAWSKDEAICIPFIDKRKPGGHYWPEEEEVELAWRLRNLFLHPNIRWIAQNGVYDIQHIARQWGVLPKLWHDTMIMHHVMLPGTPKSLDYLSSFYLDWHVYWKHESEEWETGLPEETLWPYNCKDCCITWEIQEKQVDALAKLNFPTTDYGPPPAIQMSLIDLVLETMLRGVKIDSQHKLTLITILDEQIAVRQQWLNEVIGEELNVRSPKQLQKFFYEDLNQRVVVNRKSGRPTTDEDALLQVAKREPLLGPIVSIINEIRQLSVAQSFCTQPLEPGKRMRCSYNIAGTETFRFASSKDAFGFGTNLQNVTTGMEGEKTKWEKEHPGQTYPDMWIPNLRKIFIPDTGFIMGEFDLKSADAQVVAAEAEEWELLRQLTDPNFDLHQLNADRWGIPTKRQNCKSIVHGTNYGGSPFAVAKATGLAEGFIRECQKDWFSRYPGIKDWHQKISHQLMTRRFIENRFGYRRFYFDRIDDLLKEALAWIPQSTVAIVTNLGIRNVKRNLPHIRFSLQTHDSATFQWASWLPATTPQDIRQQMLIAIPYKHPLTIDVAFKTSEKSWGDCK